MRSLRTYRHERNRFVRQTVTIFLLFAGSVGYFVYAMLGEDW